MVKHGGADVVQVSQKVKETSLQLIVPDLEKSRLSKKEWLRIWLKNDHLYLIVVSSGHEERLLIVKADTPYGTLVLVKLLEEGAHAVVPELDHAVVEAESNDNSGKWVKPFVLLHS